MATLTRRELEVLRMLAEGLASPAIAESLGFTAASDPNHRLDWGVPRRCCWASAPMQ
ncbi:MAG: LuxR C-terminal-related transcriptional regulator [Candidatus Acidiferrales bacterium]